MKEITQIELSDLYDLLAQHTNRYMKMLSNGGTRNDFDQCREIIISIQAEIQSRKSQMAPNNEPKSQSSTSPNYARGQHN